MTGSMAESLTGISNSAQIISNLSENHYFTEKHSVDNPIYQFHPLFREFLLSRTKGLFAPEKILSIQRKASALL
jgi:ATP/maltotriose-dependent transcriptional regulator MalT